MSDILLATINAKWIHPSLALRLLRANLGALENRSDIVEFALRQPLEEKIEAILAAKPRVLGLSVSIWNHLGTLELLRALRNRWERGDGGGRPIVILGGPEAANLPEDAPLLAECDWLIRGEGEHAFRELCGALFEGRKPVPGGPIAEVRESASCKVLEASPVDPASIDPGYRLYTDEDLARKLTYVEASRGCPFGCEFCLSSLDRKVRDFPLDSFLHEMDNLIGRGARSFKFLDRTFNLDIDRARTIMEFFLARLRPGLFVHFEMVPARFPDQLKATLERFPEGSLRLEVGIQTFNPPTAAAIGRSSAPEKELDAMAFLGSRTTATVHADLIAGLPGETLETFARGFDLLWSTHPSELQLGILKRLPGAPITRHDEPFKMRYATTPPYEVLSTSTMDEKEIERVKNFARFWELIVNRGHFPEIVPRILPADGAAFDRFLNLSDALLARFGRNWGIDRADLRSALREYAENYGV